MGLMTILRKIKEKSRAMRLLILGLDNAGKTTVVKKVNGEDIDKISPTLGFNIKTLYYNDYELNVWDVGGQVTIRSYWRNYFEATDGLIWVIDSTDKMRMNDCKKELHSLLKQEKLCGATLLIFCNKQDLEGALTASEIRDYLELDKISTRHWALIPCSAKTGEGLIEGIDWMVADISSRIFVLA